MKIKVKQLFRYQVGAKTNEIKPGTYAVPQDVSKELADKIRKFGRAEIIVEKKAPENKVVTTKTHKEAVAQVRGRRAGTKPNK